VIQLSGYDVAPRISGQVCAMLAVDIAEFTRPDRDDEIQLHLRTCLYGLLREALGGCGMPWDNGQHEDRGDGAVVIFPPDLAAQPIIDAFPDRLRCQVRRHNRYSCEPVRMQLRVAVHVGPVYRDEHGFAGDDVTYLCRMLDAQPLRRALSDSRAELAFIISDYVYEKLVLRRQSLADRRSFRRVKTQVKRTSVHGWIYLPDGPAP
jgi:class 3 adenylate cyclase